MKIIYPDNTVTITATEENSNFPIANVQDDHPKKVWKATSNDAIVTLTASSGSVVAIYGTNATSATIKSRSGAVGVAWSGPSWDSPSWVTESLTTETVTLAALATGQTAIWAEFTDPGTSFGLEMTLASAAGTTLQVGVIRCGTLRDFRDAAYGIQEGLEDFSIRKELNNGAQYYRKRDIIRTFDLELVEDRASDFYTFMHNVALLRGGAPLAWRLSERVTDWQWIVYAAFADMPFGTHRHPSHTIISIKLKEVI